MKMTRAEMDTLTDNKISRKCYTEQDEDLILVGKFVQASPNPDGTWDVWICNPKDMTKGLGERKVNNITSILSEEDCGKLPLLRLDREGVYPSMPKATLLKSLRVLGLRARMVVSDERKKKLAESLAAYRLQKATS